MSVSQACNKLYNELGGYKIKTINFDATVSVANPYTKELWFSLPAKSNILSIIGMAGQYYGWFAFSYNIGMTYSSIIVGIKNLYTTNLTDSFAVAIFYKEPKK